MLTVRAALLVALALLALSTPSTAAWAEDVPDLEVGGPRGKCVATRGLTGYSVTLAHCLPEGTAETVREVRCAVLRDC